MKQLFNSSPDELLAYNAWKALVDPVKLDIQLCITNIDRLKQFGTILYDPEVVPTSIYFEESDFALLYGIIIAISYEWGAEKCIEFLLNFFTTVTLIHNNPFQLSVSLGINAQEIEDAYALFWQKHPVTDSNYWLGSNLSQEIYVLFRKLNKMRLTGANLQYLIQKTRPVGEFWTVSYQ